MRDIIYTAGHIPLTAEPPLPSPLPGYTVFHMTYHGTRTVRELASDVAERDIDERETNANDEAEDAEYDAFLDDEELEDSL